jgi:hypothetical protein
VAVFLCTLEANEILVASILLFYGRYQSHQRDIELACEAVIGHYFISKKKVAYQFGR